MAAVNYEKMTLKELRDHQARIAKAISVVERNDRANAKQKLQAIAESLGYRLEDLASGGRTKRGKGGADFKYRNPDNPAETWSGRGRKPNWLNAKLAKGASMEDFEV